MKFIQKFEQATISLNLEQGDDLIIAIIIDQFNKEDISRRINDKNDELDEHTALIDMIVWYQNKFGKEIENEDKILKDLRNYYGINL